MGSIGREETIESGGNTGAPLIMCCEHVFGFFMFVFCFDLLLQVSDLGYPCRTRIHFYFVMFGSVFV